MCVLLFFDAIIFFQTILFYFPLVASATEIFHILIDFLINYMSLIGRHVLKPLPIKILGSCPLSFNFLCFSWCNFKAMQLVRTQKAWFHLPPPGCGILMANLLLLFTVTRQLSFREIKNEWARLGGSRL